MRRGVVLEGPEVEHLALVAEVHREQVALRAGAFQQRLAAQPGVLAAERDRRGAQRRVAADVRSLQDDRPGLRPVLLDREVLHVRVLAHDDLDHAVDEVLDVGRAEAVEDRDLALLLRDDERVREGRQPVTLGPVQDDDRLLDDDARGHAHERTAREERVVKERVGVGRRIRALAQPATDILALTGRNPADDDTLRGERVVDLVVHDATVAHDDQTGALAGFGGDDASARCVLHPGGADLLRGEWAVPVQIEVTDPAVPPDLFGRGRPRHVGKLLCRALPPVCQPIRTAERTGGARSEPGVPGQPTEPSMLSSMSRLSSTAYSIGSVFVIGSMKPFTIIATACCSLSPRLWR